MNGLPKSEQRRAELLAQVAEWEEQASTIVSLISGARREIVGLEYAIAEAKETAPIEEAKAPRAKPGEMETAILSALRDAGTLTAEQIVSALPRFNPDSIRAVLRRMSQLGEIERDSDGRYSLATKPAAEAA